MIKLILAKQLKSDKIKTCQENNFRKTINSVKKAKECKQYNIVSTQIIHVSNTT